MINTITEDSYKVVFDWLISQIKISNWFDTFDSDEDFYWKNAQLVFHINESSNLPIDFHGYWITDEVITIELPDYTISDIDDIITFKRVIRQSKEIIKTEIFYTEV